MDLLLTLPFKILKHYLLLEKKEKEEEENTVWLG